MFDSYAKNNFELTDLPKVAPEGHRPEILCTDYPWPMHGVVLEGRFVCDFKLWRLRLVGGSEPGGRRFDSLIFH